MSKWPYNTQQWQRLRKMKLRDDPLCAFCEQAGRTTIATVVDHKQRVQAKPDLAFDWSNLDSLCKTCHDSVKARQERGVGIAVGCRADGSPIDPGHHWNR